MYLIPFASYQLQEGIGDKTKGKSFCDAEGERHHQQHQERRNRLRNVVPINVDNIFEHDTSDDNQRWGNNGIQERILTDIITCPYHLISGWKKRASSIKTAVTMLVKPVRPPAEIPDALSM